MWEGNGRHSGRFPPDFGVNRLDASVEDVTVRRFLGALAAAAAAALATPAVSIAAPVPGAPSCPMFPADSWWHADISQLPVHPMSSTYVGSIGVTKALKADFGSGLWDGGPIGIPYTVVNGQPGVTVTFDYADESDLVPYPIPPNPPIEGGPQSSGDRHVLIVDAATCQLYELYAAYPNGDGSWTAGSGATWNLNDNALRPDTWTSADAAGLPILPGLVRYDEVAAGYIDHAIRVTASATSRAYLWPARHQAGTNNDALPPMGLRLRLRPDVDISGFPRDDQVILQAMKTFGLVVADNGSSWFVSGVPDERWDNDVLQVLRSVKGQDFEAVDASSLMVSYDSGQAASGIVRPTADPVAPNPQPGAQPESSNPTVAPNTTTAPSTTTTTAVTQTTTTAAQSEHADVAVRDAAGRGGGGGSWWWLLAVAVLLGSGAAALLVRLKLRAAR